jgi:hypothetical protein
MRTGLFGGSMEQPGYEPVLYIGGRTVTVRKEAFVGIDAARMAAC